MVIGWPLRFVTPKNFSWGISDNQFCCLFLTHIFSTERPAMVVVILPNLYCCYGDPRRRTHRVIYNATLRFPSFWTLEFQWETRVVCCSAPSSFKGCKIPSKNMVDFFPASNNFGGALFPEINHTDMKLKVLLPLSVGQLYTASHTSSSNLDPNVCTTVGG